MEEDCFSQLISKDDVDIINTFPKSEGTYFAGTTIEPGSYYVLADSHYSPDVMINAYSSYYKRMNDTPDVSRIGKEVVYFTLNEGEGVSIFGGSLYPVRDVEHLPSYTEESHIKTYLGGTTLPIW